MIHVIHTFPGGDNKIFKRTFVVFIVASIIFTCIFYCNDKDTKKPEEEIEQHEEDVQSNNTIAGVSELDKILSQSIAEWKPLKFVGSPLLQRFETTKQEQTDNEQEEHEDIEEEVSVENTTEEIVTAPARPNKLYYVNENGWESYLDECYQNHLYEMCVKYDVVDYYTLFLAQMYHESGFRTDVISGTNDYGLMQINICNHEWLGQKLGNSDFLDPYNNIEAGVYMMSGYLKKYNDAEKALVCYNRGESAVRNGTYSTKYSQGVLYDMTFLVELK